MNTLHCKADSLNITCTNIKGLLVRRLRALLIVDERRGLVDNGDSCGRGLPFGSNGSSDAHGGEGKADGKEDDHGQVVEFGGEVDLAVGPVVAGEALAVQGGACRIDLTVLVTVARAAAGIVACRSSRAGQRHREEDTDLQGGRWVRPDDPDTVLFADSSSFKG